MAVSNTAIGRRIPRKMDSYVVETILAAKKLPKWRKVAQRISGSRRKYSEMNLNEINSKSSEGDTIVITGKVLSGGELTKKVRVCAMSFSESALAKMKHSKSEAVKIIDEIKKNPKAEGVKIL